MWDISAVLIEYLRHRWLTFIEIIHPFINGEGNIRMVLLMKIKYYWEKNAVKMSILVFTAGMKCKTSQTVIFVVLHNRRLFVGS